MLTMVGPQNPEDAERKEYSIEDLSGILRESERLEHDFSKKYELRTATEKDIEIINKAISLRELYIANTPGDRLQNTRLMAMNAMKQNFLSMPLAEKSKELFEKAEKAFNGNEDAIAMEIYKELYDLQRRINNDYSLSENKNMERVMLVERRMRTIQAKPFYLQSLEAEERANKAMTSSDWESAQANYQIALEKLNILAVEHAGVPYIDYKRMRNIEGKLDSLRSAPMVQKMKEFLDAAKTAETAKEFMQASDFYTAAAEVQKEINKVFPKSDYASEDNFKNLLNMRDKVFGSRFSFEILEQKESIIRLISEEKYAEVSETTQNLIRKAEQFKKDFREGAFVADEIILELRYINHVVKDLPDIMPILNKSLIALDSYPKIKMFKTEISQSLYEKIMYDNPSRIKDPTLPVESVALEDIENFCKRIFWITGRKTSLPTLDMYKKALGSLKYVNLNEISWNYSNSDMKAHPVASKNANANGYFDLLGNVAELSYMKDSADQMIYFEVGGSCQTSTDVLIDFPEIKLESIARNRVMGFRIVMEDEIQKQK